MKLGFIGTGNMGRHMATNLLKAGYTLTVHDARKEATKTLLEAGAKWAESPQEVARNSEIIMASLPGPPEVETVVLGPNGILAGASKGSVFIDLSTNYPTTIKRIAGIAKDKGVDVLDAPVTGGTFGAEAGTLTIMVGGDGDVFARSRGILEAIGKRIVHIGDVGAGNAMKLINNLMGVVQVHLIAEAMVLAAKAGLDLQKVYEVLATSVVVSGTFTQQYSRRAFSGNFEPGFSVDLAYKDMRLISDLAKDSGVPLYYGNLALQQLVEMRARGLGNKDATAILLPLEELLGVKVRIKT